MDSPTPMPPAQSGGLFQGSSPKLTFIFGAIAGFAVASVVALAVFLPQIYGTKKTTTTTAAAAAPTNTAAAPTFTAPKAVSDADYIRGNKNAKLTIVEFSDYECPFCKQFHPTLLSIMDQYKDKVRWVYRQFPLSFHQNAPKEAEAGLCVGKLGGQDKFWAFSDKIFQRTTSNGTGFALTDLGPLAKEVGVDQTKFQNCLDSGEMTATVQAEEADGTAAGVTGTPTAILVDSNNTFITAIPGAYPLDQVKTMIDSALTKV